MRCLLAILCVVLLAPRPAGAATDEAVAARIRTLQTELLRSQQGDGSWLYPGYPVGITALATLALLHSDVRKDNRQVARALDYLSTHTDEKVYSEGLVACALELAGPAAYRDRIGQSVVFLAATQKGDGGWSYDQADNRTDNSNSQFAVLGLAAADRAGVAIPKPTHEAALKYWQSTGRNDGWGYRGGDKRTFPMSCAGVSSLYLLGVPYETKTECCGAYQSPNPRLDAALRQIGADIRRGEPALGNNTTYALYALERVGIFLGIHRLNDVDWYDWGCDILLQRDPRGNVADMAFMLLFLSRGAAPIAVAKWQWKGDWNRQHSDVRNWVKIAGGALDRKFDWIADDLDSLDTPAVKASMIYVTGSRPFTATDEEVDIIRSFLEAGGTLVADATCGGRQFWDGFETVMTTRLYPELNPTFVPLPPDHEVLHSFHDLTPDNLDARQLYCGCRNVRVLFLGRAISCALNGDLDTLHDQHRAWRVATNILAWSLGKRAADKKLDRVRLEHVAAKETMTPDQLREVTARTARQYVQPFARLRHDGDWRFAPTFFPNLKVLLNVHPMLPACDAEIYAQADSGDLYQSAVAFITGHRETGLDQRERLGLRTYLQNGGFLLAVAACSSTEFDVSFRQLMKNVLPNDEFEPVPAGDPVWRAPYNLAAKAPRGTPAYYKRFGEGWGPLLGIRREGRWIVIYCPVDAVSDLADGLHPDVPGYTKESAYQLVTNILTYAFTPADL